QQETNGRDRAHGRRRLPAGRQHRLHRQGEQKGQGRLLQVQPSALECGKRPDGMVRREGDPQDRELTRSQLCLRKGRSSGGPLAVRPQCVVVLATASSRHGPHDPAPRQGRRTVCEEESEKMTPSAAVRAPAAAAARMNLIGGKWQPASGGGTLDVVSPSDGLEFARIARGTAMDVDAAVQTARKAFDEGAWGRMPAVERGRLLTRLAQKILDHFDALAELEARDTGKPMKQARADITAAARYFEYYGGAADKVHGDTVPFLDGYLVTILREPHGVTGHIIPWNYPAQMFGRSLAPALAMGNACVMKPAEDACMTPLRLAELALEAGFPEGSINVVTGLGEEAGAALASHPDINFLSFTG